MSESQQSLETLRDIKLMMERSSRFISLSGLSGISAGICALTGAWMAYPYLQGSREYIINSRAGLNSMQDVSLLNTWLFWIAAGTFIMALISAFIFTWIKSRREDIPIWGTTAKRLLINVSIPLLAGAVFLIRLIHFGAFGLVAPGCLIFYGLALINAGKYTLPEIRYLGVLQILLGIINLWFTGYGLYFWASGFGILHLLYGIYMWMKYDRT